MTGKKKKKRVQLCPKTERKEKRGRKIEKNERRAINLLLLPSQYNGGFGFETIVSPRKKKKNLLKESSGRN